MMLQLINDVKKALDAECYYSALTLALTFPDICGKAEYPEKKTAERYKDWYDDQIGKYEQCTCEQFRDMPMPYLSGQVVYSLRNFMLHQGTPNINVNRINNPTNKIDYFELAIESKKPFDIYCNKSSNTNGFSTYRVNIRSLCLKLYTSAEAYYVKNKDKFDFFNCSIINWDSEVDKILNLNQVR